MTSYPRRSFDATFDRLNLAGYPVTYAWTDEGEPYAEMTTEPGTGNARIVAVFEDRVGAWTHEAWDAAPDDRWEVEDVDDDDDPNRPDWVVYWTTFEQLVEALDDPAGYNHRR